MTRHKSVNAKPLEGLTLAADPKGLGICMMYILGPRLCMLKPILETEVYTTHAPGLLGLQLIQRLLYAHIRRKHQ